MAIMNSTVVEMVRVPYGAREFHGLRQTEGRVVGEYAMDHPIQVKGGEMLFVEIRPSDRVSGRCRVVSVEPQGDYFSGMSSTRYKAPSRKAPLPAAEASALVAVQRARMEDESEREFLCIEAKQAARLLFERSGLSERQERVVRLRLLHGLELKEVAMQFGVTAERIRQCEAKALKKMKRAAGALRRVGAI